MTLSFIFPVTKNQIIKFCKNKIHFPPVHSPVVLSFSNESSLPPSCLESFLTNSLLSQRHTLNHFGPRRILKSLTFLLTFCILIRWRGTIFFPVRFSSVLFSFFICFFRLKFIVKRIAITTRANRQPAIFLMAPPVSVWEYPVGVGRVCGVQHSGVRVCHRPCSSGCV